GPTSTRATVSKTPRSRALDTSTRRASGADATRPPTQSATTTPTPIQIHRLATGWADPTPTAGARNPNNGKRLPAIPGACPLRDRRDSPRARKLDPGGPHGKRRAPLRAHFLGTRGPQPPGAEEFFGTGH